MKGVLAWLKSHLVMVISTVVIVVVLPLAWFFSSGMNEGIRTEQEKRASQAFNQVKNARVTYVIPSLLPGEEAVTETRPPNAVVTEFYQQQRAERAAQAAQVVETVLEFNRDGHELLAPDLLPEPEDPRQATRLKYDFLAMMAGDRRTGRETIYRDLIRGIGAGEPPDPVRLATTIQDLRERETERMLAEAGTGTLSPEQQAELTKLLADRRLAEAQRRAREVSVYMTLRAFDPTAFGPEHTAQVPPLDREDRPNKTEPPSLAEAFGWNFDYWVVSDLLRAIDRANTDAGGTRANVENALVKRVQQIAIEKLPVDAAPEGEEDPYAAPADDFGAAGGEGTDPSVSITGRVGTDEYDVIQARLTLVADATRLPQLFKALAETNLFTVLDFDVTEVDLWEDLRQGYYYGDAPVVRVEMLVETIWLREWTAPMMPQSVKDALGIVTEEPLDGGEG